MSKYERAAQFWAVLVMAAHNRQLLTYEMMEGATGIPKYGQSQFLELIWQYCHVHGLPKLTTLVVGKDDGLPQDKSETPETVCRRHAEVFNADWLSHKSPSPDDFKNAEGRAATV